LVSVRETAGQRHLDPAALAQLKGLTLRARSVVDGVLQGVHKSPHHGVSIEFSEHKEYSPGDEMRHIDWRAVGRLDKLFVKRFEQETNTRAYFVIDTSGSMRYGADGVLNKFDYSGVLAVSLAYLLLRQQDAVGMVTYADKVAAMLPPRARSTHLMQMCDVLAKQSPDGGTSLSTALTALSDVATKKGFIYLFTDFFSQDYKQEFRLLRQLVSRGHQITAFHVLDRNELEFPFDEMAMFEGIETGRRLLVEPRLIRERYLERLADHQAEVRRRCLESRVAHVMVDTGEPPSAVLTRYLGRQATQRR